MGLLGPDAKLRAHGACGPRGDRRRRDRGSRSRLRAHRASRRTGENAACRARHRDQRAHDCGARNGPGRKRYPGDGCRRCSCAGCSRQWERAAGTARTAARTSPSRCRGDATTAPVLRTRLIAATRQATKPVRQPFPYYERDRSPPMRRLRRRSRNPIEHPRLLQRAQCRLRRRHSPRLVQRRRIRQQCRVPIPISWQVRRRFR